MAQMDIEPSYIIQHLRSVVIHSLDTFNLANAEFAAERLVATIPEDPDAVYLYALALYRQGKYKAALNGTSAVFEHGDDHLGCAYIYARSCLHLSKYKEGIYRLVSLSHMYNDSANHEFEAKQGDSMAQKVAGEATPPATFHQPHNRHGYEFKRSILPESSSIYHLLGDLYKAQGDTKSSILNYNQALRYNPFDFEALQELAKSGADLSVKALYKNASPTSAGSESTFSQLVSKMPSSEPSDAGIGEKPRVPNPFATTPRQPRSLQHEVSTPRVGIPGVPDAPLRRTHGTDVADASKSGMMAPFSRLGDNKTPTTAPRSLSFVKRRPELAPAENPRNLKRGSSSSLLATSTEARGSNSKDIEAADAYLRRLYSVFAKSYKCFSRYDCYKAIRILESLPENEQNTPWVLSKLGRLHYEIVNYKQSKRFFVRLRQLDRTRLEDMEYYSTLLWHLHRKVELTYLANELHDIDSNSAITWCVMGNLFSLTREPDEAIKCFNKSLAIDPKFTYAHTLKGHEYFGNDNYERALDCFRYSILLDPRHYNAFYGIGMVYINLGEYQKADYHFRKAVAINPINIILICCVGMVLEKLGKKTLALRQYELANKLQPLSALPIFKKAQLLFSMQHFPQALEQFELVKKFAPNEASVHFLLGQLYNIQNDKFSAIREFTIALNLDPKGNYLIRETMEMLKDG